MLVAYTDMLNQTNTVLGQANARNNQHNYFHMAQHSHISKAAKVEKLETSFGTLVQACLGTVEHCSFVTCVNIPKLWVGRETPKQSRYLSKSMFRSSLTNRPAGTFPEAPTDISAVVFAHKQDAPPSE